MKAPEIRRTNVDAAGTTTLADEPGRAEDVIVINDDVAFPSMNERRGL